MRSGFVLYQDPEPDRFRLVTMKTILTFFLCLALAAWPISAQMGIAQPVTIGDLTGNSGAQQLSSSAINARWVLVVALTTNAASVRVGDSNVSATRGAQVAPGGGIYFPALPMNQNAQNQNTWDLSKIYFFAASPNAISVVYGK